MTEYDHLLPLARKLVKGLASKPGVHVVDKEIVAGFLAQALCGAIGRGELLTEGTPKRTASDLEAELKRVSDALVDVLDGESEHDIHAQTGLPKERCNEIYAIYARLVLAPEG